MIWKLTNCQCMKKKKIVSICEFSSKKIHDLELHTITKLDNKCDFKTEPSQIFTYLKHLSGTKVFKCSDFLSRTRNSTKTRESKIKLGLSWPSSSQVGSSRLSFS